ncbi:MAG: DNA polymerase I [Bacillota bacterium]|jgi:DNA polymerase-1
MAKKPRLFLLDGHSLAFRAFYALPLLSTASGRYTNAVYGFAMMLTRLLDDHQPEYIAVAFDLGRPTVRLQRYPEYKGTRQKTPNEMSEQIPYIKEILAGYRIPILEFPGYEADDIIGTLAAKAERAGVQAVIVTGDRDALQLVSRDVTVMLTKKGISDMETQDPAAIEARYGLSPHQLIDLKALMGDSSDNIPGVPGIGEKTGSKLISAAGSLSNLLADPAAYATKRQVQLLKTYHDQALLSQELATIVRDLPLEIELTDLKRQAADYSALGKAYREYELKSLLERLPAEQADAVSAEERLSCQVCSLQQAEDWALLLQQAKDNGKLAMAWDRHPSGQISLAMTVDGEQVFTLPDIAGCTDQLEALFSLAGLRLWGHDCKEMDVALRSYRLHLPEPNGDTLLAAYLLEPSQTDYSLPRLAEAYLGQQLVPEQGEPLQALARDAAAIFRVLPHLEQRLAERELEYLYRQVELPLSSVLAAMELRGVSVDQQVLKAMQADFEQRLAAIMADIHSLAGEEFNINSPKQLGRVLFEQLRLPVIKKTKTGYSTDAEVLEALADQHAIVNNILQYRQLAKLKSTYLDGLLQVVDPIDSKVHTTYHQTVTTTGRLSSSEPNLQNIPIRLAEGREIRKAFLPGPGFDLILAADYSQIELRILAHISQDPILIKSFINDEDIHTRTAAEVFGVALSEVTSEMRARAKAVNFGIVYGISDYGLSRDLRISRAEAKAYIDRYFARYAGVKNYIDRVIGQARSDGFVTTLLQRRRYLPDINSRNYNLRSFAERTAMNTPIQGSAADQIKLAMVNIERRLRQGGFDSQMILQVHDELIFEVPTDELRDVARLVREEMEQALSLLVPLKVDVKVGSNWLNVAPFAE